MADKDEKIFQEVYDGSNKAISALNNLENAVKSLDRISSSSKGIEAFSKSLTTLKGTLDSLNDLPKISNALSRIDFTVFSSNMKKLSASLEPFRGFRSSAGAILNGLTKLNLAVDNVNSTDYDLFSSNIELLASSLNSLTKIQSTIGTTLSSLSKLSDVIDQVSILGRKTDEGVINAEGFKSNILSLADALLPLNNMKISSGNIITQLSKLVDTVKIINNQFTSEMAKTFKEKLSLLATALTRISDAKIGKISVGSTINSINKLLDVIARLENVKSSFRTNFFELLDRLAVAMAKLSEVGKVNIGGFVNSVGKLVEAVISLNSVSVKGTVNGVTILDSVLEMVTNRLISLSTIGKVNIGGFINSIIRLIPALQELNKVKPSSVEKLSSVLDTLVLKLRNFEGLKTSGFSSSINAIAKLPVVISELNNIDQSNIDNFINRVTELSEKLTPLAQKLAPIATILNNINIASGKTSSNFNKVANETNKTTTLFGKLKQALGGFGVIFSFRALYNILSKCFDLSNDYIENLNVVAVSLGRASDGATKYADSLHMALGIDPSEFLRQWSEFNLQLKGFGNGSDEWNEKASLMSKNLTQLGYDLASLYNVDIETAMTKLSSGMSGMSKPLRNWGFDISQAALQEYAFSVGIDKNVQSMNQAEKAQLRYGLIMSKTVDIQGDFAKTLETPANQLRVLKAQITQLGRAVGTFITPVVAAAIPYVRAFISALTDMFKALASTMMSLTGYKQEEINDFLKEISKDASDSEDSIDSLEESMGNLVSGIDKFNVLNTGSKKTFGGFFEGLETYDYTSVFSKVAEKASDSMKEIKGSIEPVLNVIKGLIEGILYALDSLGGPLETIKKVTLLFVSLKLPGLITKIVGAISSANASLIAFKATEEAVLAITNTLTNLAISSLIYTLWQLITNWENLGEVERVIYIIIAAVSALILVIKLLNVELIKKFIPLAITGLKSLLSLIFSLKFITTSLAVVGILYFISQLKELGTVSKILIPVISVLAGVAAALIAIKVAGAGLAAGIQAGLIATGIALGVGTLVAKLADTKKFSNGGFTSPGTNFIAGERGPEWVGSQGSSSVILNDSQMSDIMYDAVRDGVLEAMSRSSSPDNRPVVYVNFDSKEFIRANTSAIMTEAERQNYTIAKRR